MWNSELKGGLNCYNIKDKTIYKVADNKQQFMNYLNNDDCSIVNVDHLIYATKTEAKNIEAQLPAGYYKTIEIGFTQYLCKIDLGKTEEILELDISNGIIKDFNSFVNSRSVYKDLKLMYKRGILVYGPPGTGKSSAINKVLKQHMPTDCLVIFINELLDPSYLKALKEDSRLKIIIFEEVTNLLDGRGEGVCPAELLDFLDGEKSLDNCFIIATTNYPELLPKNLTDRPGRFDRFYKVDTLRENDVKVYLNHFDIDVVEEEIQSLVGKTIAETKEIILIHKRDNVSLLEASKAIEKQKELVNLNFESENRMGFIL